MDGDKAAESEIVSALERPLRLILAKKFNFAAFVDDALQETLIAVLISLRDKRVKRLESVPAYARQTAIRIGFQYLNKDQRERPLSKEEIPDSAECLHKLIEKEDLLRYTKKVIGELATERDRELLIRYYYNAEEKSHVCEALGLSSEHFDRVLYRAKKRLKELIKKKTAGEDDDNNRPKCEDSPSYRTMEGNAQETAYRRQTVLSILLGLWPIGELSYDD